MDAGHYLVAVFAKMLDEAEGNGCFINIVAEQKFGIDGMGQLQMAATPAQVEIERVKRLFLPESRGRNIVVFDGRWRQAKREVECRAVTKAASRSLRTGWLH